MLAFVLGVICIIINFLIYQQKSGKRLLVLKLVSDIFWCAHYFSLYAYTGAFVALLGAVREVVFIKVDRKSKISKFFLAFFCVLSLAIAVFTWKNIFSAFPAIASILSVISFYMANPQISRIMSFPISSCMFTYSLISNSFAGVINEIITVTSSIIGIIKKEKNNG